MIIPHPPSVFARAMQWAGFAVVFTLHTLAQVNPAPAPAANAVAEAAKEAPVGWETKKVSEFRTSLLDTCAMKLFLTSDGLKDTDEVKLPTGPWQGSFVDVLTAKNGWLAYLDGDDLHLTKATLAQRDLMQVEHKVFQKVARSLVNRGLLTERADPPRYEQRQNLLCCVDGIFVLIQGHGEFVTKTKAALAAANSGTGEGNRMSLPSQAVAQQEKTTPAARAGGFEIEEDKGPLQNAMTPEFIAAQTAQAVAPEPADEVLDVLASLCNCPGYEIMPLRFQNVAVSNSVLALKNATNVIGQVSEPGIFAAFQAIAGQQFDLEIDPAKGNAVAVIESFQARVKLAEARLEAAQQAEAKTAGGKQAETNRVYAVQALEAARKEAARAVEAAREDAAGAEVRRVQLAATLQARAEASEYYHPLYRERLSAITGEVGGSKAEAAATADVPRDFASLAATPEGRSALARALAPPDPGLPPTLQRLTPAGIPSVNLSDFIPPERESVVFGSSNRAAFKVRTTEAAGGAAAPAKPHKVAFIVDRLSNTILVFDNKDRKAGYEKIRSLLDQPIPMVRITADIIDVDVEQSSQWGADLALRGARDLGGRSSFSGRGAFEGGLAFPTTPSSPFIDANGAQSDYGISAAGDPFGLAFEVRGSSTVLRARLQALLANGMACVHAQPELVTTNNRKAYYQSVQSVVFPGKGEITAQLYRASAPFAIEVTPSIASKTGGQIYIDVVITDSGLDNSQAVLEKGLSATIKESKIETRALMQDGESLLVGGRQREFHFDNAARHPVLGRLPVVGHAFKDQTGFIKRQRRYFLLTPTILPESRSGKAPISFSK